MKEFWNSRYRAAEFAYGKDPNRFFAEEILSLKPGIALFPAEGEGRNAVFAAKSGWEVTAFDISEAGKTKAVRLAEEQNVRINYQVLALEEFDCEKESVDLIVLIFAHFPVEKRKAYHRHLIQFLKPGGIIILEGFSKAHIKFNSVNEKAGGPKNESMLFSKLELREDFEGLEFISLREDIVCLDEGLYHSGESGVIRLLARKPH